MLSVFYTPQHDLKNWLRIAAADDATFSLTRFYPFDRSIALRPDQADRIISSLPSETLALFTAQAQDLESAWRGIEPRALDAIAAHLGYRLQPISARAALTTAYRMPYDVQDQWFMVPTHKSLHDQQRVILHELFHLYHLQRDPTLRREELEKTVSDFLSQQSLL